MLFGVGWLSERSMRLSAEIAEALRSVDGKLYPADESLNATNFLPRHRSSQSAVILRKFCFISKGILSWLNWKGRDSDSIEVCVLNGTAPDRFIIIAIEACRANKVDYSKDFRRATGTVDAFRHKSGSFKPQHHVKRTRSSEPAGSRHSASFHYYALSLTCELPIQRHSNSKAHFVHIYGSPRIYEEVSSAVAGWKETSRRCLPC